MRCAAVRRTDSRRRMCSAARRPGGSHDDESITGAFPIPEPSLPDSNDVKSIGAGLQPYTARRCDPACTESARHGSRRQNFTAVSPCVLERSPGIALCHCSVTSTSITPVPFGSGSSALPTTAPNIRLRLVPFMA